MANTNLNEEPTDVLQHHRPDATPEHEPLSSQYPTRAHEIKPGVQLKANKHILPITQTRIYDAIRQVEEFLATGEIEQAVDLCLSLLNNSCLPKVPRMKFHLLIAEDHLRSGRHIGAKNHARLASGIVQCDYELIDTRSILQKYASLWQSLGLSVEVDISQGQQLFTRSFEEDPHNRPCNHKSMAALKPPGDRLHKSGDWKEAAQSYLTFLQQQPYAFTVTRFKALVRLAGYAVHHEEPDNACWYLYEANQLLSSDQELQEREHVFEKLEQLWKTLEKEALRKDQGGVIEGEAKNVAEPIEAKRKGKDHGKVSTRKRKTKAPA